MRYLESDEKKYAERKKNLTNQSTSSSSSIDVIENKNISNNDSQDTLNDKDIDDIGEKLSSASLSDHLNNKEADPSTSENIYKDRLKPIQTKLNEYPKVSGRCFQNKWYDTFCWLEYSVLKNKVYCFSCRFFDTMVNSTSINLKEGL